MTGLLVAVGLLLVAVSLGADAVRRVERDPLPWFDLPVRLTRGLRVAGIGLLVAGLAFSLFP